MAMLGIILILVAMLVALVYSMECENDLRHGKNFARSRVWR